MFIDKLSSTYIYIYIYIYIHCRFGDFKQDVRYVFWVPQCI